MPRWGVKNTGASWPAVALAAGLFCATAYGASTVLDPAQVAREFSQRSWQKKDGLPDNTIRALLQTRDGYLWIGTSRGLARFDGLKFVVFDHLNSSEMMNDDCLSLAEDLTGNLWIGTADGLLRLRAGKFKRFTRKDGLAFPSNVARDRIGAVHANPRGGVWVATVGLDWLRDETIQNFNQAEGLLREGLFSLHEDADGVLWVCGPFLHQFKERKGRFEVDPESQSLALNVISAQHDGAGGLWLLCDKDHLGSWLYHFRDGHWNRAWEFGPGFHSRVLKADRSGDLWTSTDGGLDRFHNRQFTQYLFPPETPPVHVLCLIEDREGNLWFGTEPNGLHCWKPKGISAYGTHEGLAHGVTWTVCEARDGSVWIGTEQGVSQFKEGRFRNFTKGDGLSGDKIRSVAEDAAGNIWVGTGSGLSVLSNGVVRQQSFPHKLEMNKTRVVHPAKNGDLWLGTVDGLFRLREGAWTTFRMAEGLANGDVRALREGKAGNLWIGTGGGGLQSFRDGKFTTWTTNGLSNNFVWALHEDADGVLWIGTESGLNRFENNRFTVFTKREGLPADLVNEILEDDLGNLWVSHDHGIYRVRKSELNEVATGRANKVQAVSYDEADGLPSNETNGQKSYPAGCKTRDGRLWFPTMKGVAVINPRLCDLDTVAPQAAIEQVRADGEIIYDNAGPGPRGLEFRLKAELRTPVPLRLPPGSGRVLEFRFTAPVFTAPERAAFRYRLRGADDRWIEVDARREAYFTRLRPGDYNFEVMAANHRGVWGEQVANFAFSIAPFYYQTWWFFLITGFAVASMIASVVVWRLRELRKLHQLQQQSAITDERTRIAKDLHDGLGADLTRLALLADLADQEISATASGHRQKLSQSSREAARTLKEMIWIANPANDTVEGLVSRIGQTAEDFLGDARIRCRLDLASQLPQHSLSLDQRRNLLLVAREALNNIVKHAAATEVCLRAHGSENHLHLAIEDNGRGFETATARPDGLGLASMRRRVENLGGTFELESRPGVGTKILITIKLG